MFNARHIDCLHTKIIALRSFFGANLMLLIYLVIKFRFFK